MALPNWYQHALEFGHLSDGFRFWVGQRSRSLQGQGSLLRFFSKCAYIFYQFLPNKHVYIMAKEYMILRSGSSQVKGHISNLATVTLFFTDFH